MAAIRERYSSAVHSGSLTVDEKTTYSDSDVLGAHGLADKHLTAGFVTTGPDGQGYPVKPAPLAVGLERLFAGDNSATHAIVRALAEMVFEQSWVEKVKLSRVQADDMARACLAWHRGGTCKACGGHGKTLIPGTKTHSDHDCQACYDRRLGAATGKIPFERNFRQEWQPLARWLVVEMERESGRAGQAAMRAIAPKLDF